MAMLDEYGTPVQEDQRVPFQVQLGEPDTRVPFLTDDAATPVSGDTARYRAMKMHIAFGDTSPGIDALEQAITTGQERNIRTNLASQLTAEKKQKVADNINRLVKDTKVITPDIALAAQRMLGQVPEVPPETVVEESFADKFNRRTLALIAQRDRNIAQKAFEEDPNAALDTLKGHDRLLARREIIRTELEDARSRYDAQNWGKWGWNTAKDFIPGVAGVQQSPDWDPRNIFQPGSSMQAEVQKFWSFNKLSDARNWLHGRITEIGKSNTNAALHYAENMLTFTHHDSAFMDAMGVFDLQMVGSLGLGLARGTLKSTSALKNVLKDSEKAINPVTGKVDPILQQGATGDISGASQAQAVKNILYGADTTGQATPVIDQARLLSQPNTIIGVNTPLVVQQRAQKVVKTLTEQSEEIAKALTSGRWAERLPEAKVAQAVKFTEENLIAEVPTINGQILDKKIIVHPYTHTRAVEFQIGPLRESPEAVLNAMEKEHGLGFQRIIPENTPSAQAIAAHKKRLSDNVVAKGSLAEQAQIAAAEGRPVAGPTQFQTSMGSSYTVHADGTTTRLKKARPEHTKTIWANKDTDIPVEVIHSEKPSAGPNGRMYQAVKYEGKKSYVPTDELKTKFDEGLKERSTKTVYLTQEQANRLAPPMGSHRMVDNGDGTLSLATRAQGDRGKWGISPDQRNVPYASEPAKGLIPLELWRKADTANNKIISQWIGQHPVYPEHHFGNKIVEVLKSSPEDVEALLYKLEQGGAQFLEGDRSVANAQQALNESATMEIKQEGNRWYASILKPLNETEAGIRADLASVSLKNENPVSLGNFLLGGLLRSAQDQLAYFQRGARNIVTHLPQELMRSMQEIAKNIGALKGNAFKELQNVLEVDMNTVSLMNAKPVRGKAHLSQQSLEKAWMDINKSLPTEQQSLAYWSYHQLMAADWVMRNMGVGRDLLRQGVEHYSFSIGNETVFAPGRFEKELPWNHRENFGILVNVDGIPQHFWKNDLLKNRIRDVIEQMHADGKLKVIQIANPADRPFRDLSKPVKNTVNFIVTDVYDSKPLPMNLVDWNPGVHIVYPQPWFVKQPIMATGEKGLLRWYGDKTILAADNEKQANQWSSAISEVQRMFKDKVPDATIDAYIAKNLPEDLKYWKEHFYSNKGDPFLDLEHPIGSVASGKTFYDTHPKLKPSGLTDERNSEFNLFGSIDMDFLANRDGPLMTIGNRGTAEAPVYKMEKARTLDPFKSLTRGLVTSIDSLVVNNAKYAAIEQWVAQYKYLMPNPEEAAANPFRAFYGYTPDKSLWTRPDVASAVNTRERVIQFLGTNTEFGKDLNWLQQKMLNTFGDKEARWYNDHELRFLKDPLGFTKAWMFNFKFGFLNPGQFIVQGMGYANVLALSKSYADAGRALSGYMVSRALRMTNDPATINRLANIAGKMGWGDGKTFIEAYQSMRSVGYDIIGKELSVNSHTFDPNIFKNGFNTALEWGRIPFTEGERLTRETSWFTAFQEWKKLNPNKIADNFDIAQIITRADDMGANMTKASHSRLQEGIFSPLSQFYTFSHRMLELFWGGRLTWQEKMKAGFTHSVLFGVPITAAIGIPWPVNDSLKQYLMEENPELLDNGWYKAATEGFLSYMTHWITDTEYNVEQRYGPGFGDYFKKLFGGELSAVEVFAGASGSFLKSLAKSVYPFYAHIMLGMTGRQDEMPLVKEDIFEVLREISSFNNAYNAVYAINTGKYLSRNDTFVQEGLTTTDAAMMMLGLTRKDITDTRLMVQSLKNQKEAQQKIAVLAEKELKRAYTYMGDGDWQKAETHMIRAKAMMTAVGDFTDDLVATTLKRAVNDGTPLASKIKQDFVTKGNKSQLPARLQRLYDGKITQ